MQVTTSYNQIAVGSGSDWSGKVLCRQKGKLQFLPDLTGFIFQRFFRRNLVWEAAMVFYFFSILSRLLSVAQYTKDYVLKLL